MTKVINGKDLSVDVKFSLSTKLCEKLELLMVQTEQETDEKSSKSKVVNKLIEQEKVRKMHIEKIKSESKKPVQLTIKASSKEKLMRMAEKNNTTMTSVIEYLINNAYFKLIEKTIASSFNQDEPQSEISALLNDIEN